MKPLTTLLLTAVLLCSCSSSRNATTSVNSTGEKAHKKQQKSLSRVYGRNYNAPHKFKRDIFK